MTVERKAGTMASVTKQVKKAARRCQTAGGTSSNGRQGIWVSSEKQPQDDGGQPRKKESAKRA